MSESVQVNGQTFEAHRIPVVSSNAQWSEFLLEDGSVLRLLPVIVKVLAVPGLAAPDGQPAYQWTTNMVHDLITAKPKGDSHADAG